MADLQLTPHSRVCKGAELEALASRNLHLVVSCLYTGVIMHMVCSLDDSVGPVPLDYWRLVAPPLNGIIFDHHRRVQISVVLSRA